MQERENEPVKLEWNREGNESNIPSRGEFVVVRHYKDGVAGDADSVEGRIRYANRLIEGDNLNCIKGLLDRGYSGKVDLIYIDPPFWTGENYYTKKPVKGPQNLVREEVLAYKDTWTGGLPGYLEMMESRLVLMRELLSETGNIFVHVDWHAGHYIKVLLDGIFGWKNLRNEIIWHYGGPSPVKTSFPRKHDVIFFYSKSGKFYFKPQYNPMKAYLVKRARKNPDGRLWVDQNVGKITEQKFQELKSEGKIFTTKTGKFRRKQFLDEMAGDMVDDVWEIPIINSQAKERLGYPTQKPEALLRRIIECASREGDLVADFFAGSGTTLVVANRLGREWIGVDGSGVSVDLIEKRLESEGSVEFTVEKFQPVSTSFNQFQ
ncbi:MAG: site-specific DNA-methyltransferase [Promethearchaeota archaeon]